MVDGGRGDYFKCSCFYVSLEEFGHRLGSPSSDHHGGLAGAGDDVHIDAGRQEETLDGFEGSGRIVGASYAQMKSG